MRCKDRYGSGYSLIELLVVVAIVGVLTLVGLSTLGDRRGNSVRSVMDQIEGVLMNAQNAAVLSSMDIYVSSTGNWTDGSLIIDARPLNPAVVSYPPTAANIKAGVDANRLGGNSECFRSRYLTDRDHQSAGVNTGTNWYNTALGSATDLVSTSPVSTNAGLVAAMGNPLCLGTAGGDSYVILNGQTRRFETGFKVVVVGLTNGAPVSGGPIGVILVPANSSNVYKFYKQGGSTTWRRL
jgi:prepilin-type N-terminal cleavage/methylation domain-containing protein